MSPNDEEQGRKEKVEGALHHPVSVRSRDGVRE